MSSVKERLIGAITIMNETDAQSLWDSIQKSYVSKRKSWADIETIEPDSADAQMLKEIEADPECHEFAAPDEALKLFD